MDTAISLVPFDVLLYRYRRAAGLSQEELAERAHLSVSAISALERGLNRAPHRSTLNRLAEALTLTDEERALFAAAVSRKRRPAATPAPRAQRDPRATNLHTPSTSFIGRAREQAIVRRLLESTRLLTLTGTGGIGKTRIATHVAAALSAGESQSYPYPDGVWLVELAALADPSLIPQAVAQTLDVREAPGRPLLGTLTEALREKELLLLLDNCEHLLPATGAFVETLLRACSRLRILVTSREALGALGETVWWVPSLSVPSPESSVLRAANYSGLRTEDSGLEQADAVRLFVDRAATVQPAFALTDANALAVVTICRRLDGIPLAIELAAARTRILIPEQIAARLDERFRLLTGGDAAIPRHQTLRAALDWSHELLSEPEQRLLARLSVFTGGCDIEAAAAVCVDDLVPRDALFDLLTGLVEKSLVSVEYRGDTARYRLLETIREYAQERLAASEEREARQRRHADWALALVERAAPRLLGPEQETWLPRLEVDHDNLRATLQWSLDSDKTVLGMRLAGAFWRYWQARGHFTEGRGWLDRLLTRASDAPPSMRAAALLGASALAYDQGDFAGAVPYAEACLDLAPATDETAAEALLTLGVLAWRRSDYATATARCQECLLAVRATDNRRLIARCFNLLGLIALDRGEYATAADHFGEALALVRALGDLRMSALLLFDLGLVAHRLDEFERARSFVEESLDLSRRLDNPDITSRNLMLLALIARATDDSDTALHAALEALALAREVQNRNGIAEALSQLTAITRKRGDLHAARDYSAEHLRTAQQVGDPVQILAAITEAALNARAGGNAERAVRLLAASEAYREAIELAQHPGMRRVIDDHATALRNTLGDTAFAAAWAEGTAMSVDEAIAYALASGGPHPPTPSPNAGRGGVHSGGA